MNSEQVGARESHMTRVIQEGLLSVLTKHQKKVTIINTYAAGVSPSGDAPFRSKYIEGSSKSPRKTHAEMSNP